MSNVAIRPAGTADVTALCRLVSAYHQHEDLTDPPNLEAAIKSLLTAPHRGCIWLAFAEGRAVGYIVAVQGFSLAAGGEALIIDQLFVEADPLHQSVGRLLMAAVEVHGELQGCRSIQLEIGNHNRTAQTFYAANGFTPRLRRVWERPLAQRPSAVPVA